MQDIVFRLPHRLRTLKLSSVMPLLEYLHGLPQEPCVDRNLAAHEDETACSLLLCLPLPADAPRLQRMIELYADPEHQCNRTLGVWYGIARAVARLIQDGD